MVSPSPAGVAAILLVAGGLFAACGDDPAGPPPARMELVAGDGQVGTVATVLPTDPGVRVTGDDGRPSPGRRVVFRVERGFGSVEPAAVTTDAEGVATTSWTLGTEAGPQRVVAEVGSVPAIRFTATAAPGAPTTLELFEPPAEVMRGFTTELTVQAFDAYGNEVTGEVVRLESSDRAVIRADGNEVRGVAPGRGTITARVDSATATTAAIRVVEPDARLSAGDDHTCAVGSDGVLLCWGSHRWGQLGVGSAPDRCGEDPSSECATRPQSVAGSGSVSTVAAGAFHTCVLETDGAARCWGLNRAGQVGVADTGERCGAETGVPVACARTPVAVAGAPPLVELTAGLDHTCGLADDGSAWCWGGNGSGQLGNRSEESSVQPVRVAGGDAFVELAAGWNHTCGRVEDGRVLCWGEGDFGQLGTGAQVERVDAPREVVTDARFISLSSGSRHTCGVAGNATVSCWGLNLHLQLGHNSADCLTPLGIFPCSAEVLRVRDDVRAATVGVGNRFSCGVEVRGIAWCWGASRGSLGNGVIVNRVSPPVRVLGTELFGPLDGGSGHACAITDRREVRCWGFNRWGQVGDGSVIRRAAPVGVTVLP